MTTGGRNEDDTGEETLDSGTAVEKSPRDVSTDGGAAGADEVALDPWGSSTVEDYRKLFEEFGIEEFDEILPAVANPHYLMRRGVIFGHRDYEPVANALAEGGDAAVLSGFMPTGDPHIGHKLVFDEIIWHQQQGADAYGLIADLEAHAARGLSWEEIDEHTRNYLLSLLALGFDSEAGTLYRQSTNRAVQDLAFELGIEANVSELGAIYGFDGETDVSHIQSVLTQMADILYPQLDGPTPTVIPVGPDQDPHVRLARDLARRMRYFGVTTAYASFEVDDDERPIVARAYDAREAYAEDPDQPRCAEAAAWLKRGPERDNESQTSDEGDRDGSDRDGSDRDGGDRDGSDRDGGDRDGGDRDAVGLEEAFDRETISTVTKKLENAGMEPLRPRTRFLDRRATDEAFEALIAAIDGEKRVFDAHVDAFDVEPDAAAELAREIELDHGGYGFLAPSSIYHRFMTGLTGGKMSSSVPASHISLLDDPETGYEKVKSATTGGRETAELQRELGGEADDCPVYELYAYLLAGDDDEYATRVYEECVGGERLCGDCKEEAATLMAEFLEDHQEKRAAVEDLLEDADIELESPRRG